MDAVETSVEIRLPVPRLMTVQEELEVARLAFRAQPGSSSVRERYASLLLRKDRFDEVIALLADAPEKGLPENFHLAHAYVSRHDPASDQEAEALLQAICAEVSGDAAMLAVALTLRGKLRERAGAEDEALDLHRQSFALDPHNADAFKRAVAILLGQDRAEAVLQLADEAIGKGARNPRVLASRSLALARLQRFEEAAAADGAHALLRACKPAPPAGWPTMEAFAADLAAELNAHPDISYERYGTASTRSWRIDEPALRRCRVFPALQRLIVDEVGKYLQQLAGFPHAVLEAAPARANLRMWCVLTEEDGYEEWHVHQHGWLSGTFYVAVPAHIAEGTDERGCIAFGLPEEMVGSSAAARFGQRLIRPEPGLLTIFPSHTYHRTFAHGGTGRRICCAFDVVPAAR